MQKPKPKPIKVDTVDADIALRYALTVHAHNCQRRSVSNHPYSQPFGGQSLGGYADSVPIMDAKAVVETARIFLNFIEGR